MEDSEPLGLTPASLHDLCARHKARMIPPEIISYAQWKGYRGLLALLVGKTEEPHGGKALGYLQEADDAWPTSPALAQRRAEQALSTCHMALSA